MSPEIILYRIPAILIAISFHECAHGYMAYLLGDTTAKNSGRLSLNPIHHMDIMGTICMLLTGFGWAKPVPVNPMFFKKPKEGMSLVGLAGPLSNLILAALTTILYALLLRFNLLGGSKITDYFVNFIEMMIGLNIGLAVFNLIPIPPLDGSKILAFVLPDRWYYKLMMYERYAMPLLLLLLYFNILTIPLYTLIGKVSNIFYLLQNSISGGA